MAEDSPTLDRRELARVLLRQTGLKTLRARVRRDKSWQGVYRGFRPDSLAADAFVRQASAFASDLALLTALCDAFLEDRGIARAASLKERFARLAPAEGLEDDVRAVVGLLAATDLADVPAHRDPEPTPTVRRPVEQAPAPTAAAPAEPAAPESREPDASAAAAAPEASARRRR